jgi:hypothetical protein
MRSAARLVIAVIFAASIASSVANAQQQGIMAPGDAAVTAFSGVPTQQTSERIDSDGPSLRVIALPGSGPYGLTNAAKRFTATARDIGQVFGVALDSQPAPDIFVSATSAYGLGIYRPGRGGMRNGAPGTQYTPGQFGSPDQGGGTGSIWRIDGQSGQISLFANVAFNGIQNTPASLGALAFDANTQQLFVSDRATGLIHRFGMDGVDRGTFDHGVQGRGAAHIQILPFDPSTLANIESPRFDAQNSRSWGFAPPMRRVFALAMHNGRLYYSVAANAQIWSVGIASNGAFMNDARFETAISALRPGVEISQIAFDARGQMYAAERGAPTGASDFIAVADSGLNRVFRFEPKQPGDPSPGFWHAPADEYSIGMVPNFQNADGGANLACSRTLWSTGDRLLDPGNARPGSFPAIDGLQGNDSNLVKPANMPPTQAWYVNYYDNQADPASRGHMGSIAIFNACGGAPPPSGGGIIGFNCPPGTFAVGGGCLVPPVCPEETIWRNGYCVFPHCPDGFVSIRGECRRPPIVCREGEIYLRDRCIPIGCPPQLERATNGYCRCPSGLEYRDGQCGCPRDQVRDRDGQCGCPPESIRTGQCCPPDQARDRDGKCGCPPEAIRSGQCCPPDQARDRDGKCGCPPEAIRSGQCCPPDQQRDANGRCGQPNCPPGTVTLANCPCPQGDTRNSDGRCVPNCQPGTVALANCPCPQGDTRNSDGRCVPNCVHGITATGNCPPNQSPCPPGEKLNAAGQCYTPLTLAPAKVPVPRCPRGEVRYGGRCHWPSHTTVTHVTVRHVTTTTHVNAPPITTTHVTTTVKHVTTTCGRGERMEDGRCVPAGSSTTSTGLGCSRAEYDRLGHCPTSSDKSNGPPYRGRYNGVPNNGTPNNGRPYRGNRYNNGGSNTDNGYPRDNGQNGNNRNRRYPDQNGGYYPH